MEPFRVVCTTCRARLKVRDPGLIGSIVACPKCGSMVLVEPADPAQLAGAEPADSSGSPLAAGVDLSSATFDDAASLLHDEAPPPAEPTPPPIALRASPPAAAETSASAAATPPVANVSEATPRRLDPIDPAADLPETKPDVALSDPAVAALPASRGEPVAKSSATAAEPPVALPAASPAAPPPLTPSAAWVSPEVRRLQRFAMIGVAGVMGAALAIGLFAVFVARRPPATLPPVAAAPAEEPSDVEPSDVESNDVEPPAAEPRPTEPNDLATPAPSDRADPAPPEIATPTAPASDPLVVVEPPTPAPPVAPPADEPFDPLPATPPAGVAANPPADGGDPLAALDRLLPLLGGPIPSLAGEPEVAPEPEPAAPASEPEVTPQRPAPRTIDLAARLDDPLAAIQFENTPLIDLLRFFTQLSTVPITLDTDALAALRLSPATPVSVHAGGTTVGEALGAAVSRLRLAPVVADGQIIVTRPQPQPWRQTRYTVADLAADDAALAELAALAQALLAPSSWAAAGGAGELRVDQGALLVRQSEAEHFQLIVLCEKLRLARGAAPKSSYDRLLFDTAARQQAAREQLERPLSVNYGQGALLTTIVSRLEELAAVRILLDWRSLTADGWTPDTECALVVDGGSLRQALDEIVRPRDLVWRVVDATTLEVTTRDAVAARYEVEFHPAAAVLAARGLSPDGLIGELDQRLAPAAEQLGADVRLAFDPASQTIAAALPAPLHAELVQILAELQGTASR